MNVIITNHNHNIQLGTLKNLCDDVIYVSCDFLTNKDIYNMSQLSKFRFNMHFFDAHFGTVSFSMRIKCEMNTFHEIFNQILT